MQAPDQAKQVADSSCTPALGHAYLEAGWPPGWVWSVSSQVRAPNRHVLPLAPLVPTNDRFGCGQPSFAGSCANGKVAPKNEPARAGGHA